MAQKWYPVIDYVACVECGTCVNFCPHHVYNKTKAPTPVVEHPEMCVDHCHGCGNRCPQGAITYVGEIAVGNRRMVRKGMSNPVAAVVAVAEELADEEKSSANHHTRTDSGCYRRNVVFSKIKALHLRSLIHLLILHQRKTILPIYRNICKMLTFLWPLQKQ